MECDIRGSESFLGCNVMAWCAFGDEGVLLVLQDADDEGHCTQMSLTPDEAEDLGNKLEAVAKMYGMDKDQE